MPRKPSETLTEVELEFMNILWKHPDVPPEYFRNALNAKGRSLTGGTVRKVLGILIRKGYVERSRQGKKYVYRAAVGQIPAKQGMISSLVDRVFGGSPSVMLATLFEGREVPEKDLKAIECLIINRKKKSEVL
jgi:predicted transcriptional regulator